LDRVIWCCHPERSEGSNTSAVAYYTVIPTAVEDPGLPWRRDPPYNNHPLPPKHYPTPRPCHFDRSAAKWRNLGRERWCCHPDRNGRSNTSAQSIRMRPFIDRKSTRLNSSHVKISYAVFCLKKKKIDSETLQYHCVETISD